MEHLDWRYLAGPLGTAAPGPRLDTGVLCDHGGAAVTAQAGGARGAGAPGVKGCGLVWLGVAGCKIHDTASCSVSWYVLT